MSLTSAFSSAVLPVLLVVGVGALLGARTGLDVEPLNTVALTVFLPGLVFHSLTTTTLGGATLLKLGVGVVAFAAVMLVLAAVSGLFTGVEGEKFGALLLAGTFSNAGFYGIPLVEFALGPTGRAAAVVYVAVQTVLMYTVGAFIAARTTGQSGRTSVLAVVRLPILWAILAALFARGTGVFPASGPVVTTLELVGDAAIPLMLLVVGVQVSRLDRTVVGGAVAPSVLRLMVAPLVGIGLAVALGFEDDTVARTFVLEGATPVAVVPLALVIDAGADPTDPQSAAGYLTAAILATTLVGVVTLTVLVWLFDGGTLS